MGRRAEQHRDQKGCLVMTGRMEDRVRIPPEATGLYRAMLVKSGKRADVAEIKPGLQVGHLTVRIVDLMVFL